MATLEQLQQQVAQLTAEVVQLRGQMYQKMPISSAGLADGLFANGGWGLIDGNFVVYNPDTDTYDMDTGVLSATVFLPAYPPGNTAAFGGNVYPTDWGHLPIVSGITWTNNSPTAGKVAWSAFKLNYNGTKYNVVAGNTLNKYIWWNKATSTTVLQSSNTPPAIAADQFLVCYNSSGTAMPALFQSIIYTDFIDAGAVTADKITVASLAAIQANIGAATISDKLTLNGASGAIAIGTTPPTSASAGTGLWIDRTGLYGLNANTQEFYIRATDGVGVFGGGNDTLDHAGLTILTDDGGSNGLTWKYSSAVIGLLYAAQSSHNFFANLVAQNLTDTAATVKNLQYATSNAQTVILNLQANGSTEATHPSASFGTLEVTAGLTLGSSGYPAAMLDVRGGGLFTGDVTLSNNQFFRVKDSGGTARAVAGLDGSNNMIVGAAALSANGTVTVRNPAALKGFTISATGNMGVNKDAATYTLEVDGDESLDSGHVYRVNGTQVVTARQTGWGTPTGSLYRTALTDLSLQAQFNQALMALITDLIAHGLIGA